MTIQTTDIREKIIRTLEDREHLVEGIHAVVFPVDDLVASKVYKKDEALVNALNEYCTGKSLFSDGISVPKMHYLIQIPEISEKHDDLSAWVLLMERIHGETITDVHPTRQPKVIIKWCHELDKAQKLGYSAVDMMNSDNAIYRSVDDKIFLIDFVTWSKK